MEPARDPFEELTSLYLGEPIVSPKTVTSTPPPARRPRIEPMRITVAVCGNLPVMAGIWVTQYADLEAARSGPTALVRLDGGRCSFELLRMDRDPKRFDGELMPKAAASLVGDIRRWIVCVDDRDAAAAVRAGADELVVLTSADQLALVEAYRLVKSARARAVEPDALELGVVIAGANEQAADRAASILSDMSSRHLGASLPVIALVRRLDVVERSHRVAFEESLRGDPSEVVSALRAAAEAESEADLEMETDAVLDVNEPCGTEVQEPTLRLHFPEHELDAELDDLIDGLDLEDRDLEMEIDPGLHEFDAIFADEAEPPSSPSSPARSRTSASPNSLADPTRAITGAGLRASGVHRPRRSRPSGRRGRQSHRAGAEPHERGAGSGRSSSGRSRGSGRGGEADRRRSGFGGGRIDRHRLAVRAGRAGARRRRPRGPVASGLQRS
jgi:hypothetical protein